MPITCPLVSCTAVKTPAIRPDSSRIGLNEYVKYASSAKPRRSSISGWSSCQVASPVSTTPWSIGPIWSQISGQISRSGLPSAHGCLAPSIGA